jgi:hypothetical protein
MPHLALSVLDIAGGLSAFPFILTVFLTAISITEHAIATILFGLSRIFARVLTHASGILALL